MISGLEKVKADNPENSEKDLKFIETSLSKAGEIKSFQEMKKSGLRMEVQSQDKDKFSVHIGSEDPYKDGSGASYTIDKATGRVTLTSTESYAPVSYDVGE